MRAHNPPPAHSRVVRIWMIVISALQALTRNQTTILRDASTRTKAKATRTISATRRSVCRSFDSHISSISLLVHLRPPQVEAASSLATIFHAAAKGEPSHYSDCFGGAQSRPRTYERRKGRQDTPAAPSDPADNVSVKKQRRQGPGRRFLHPSPPLPSPAFRHARSTSWFTRPRHGPGTAPGR